MCIITQITPQKRKKHRYNIHTEDGFLLSLSDESIVRHSLKVGSAISAELLDELRREDTEKYAKELALHYLTYSPRTELQLRHHLAERGIDSASIDAACAFTREYGYINDERFAETYAEAYLKKYSSYVVRQRLLAAGVDARTADRVLEARDGSEQLKELFEKLSRKYENEEPLKRKKKICDALARRGFSWSEVSALFRDSED